MVRTKVEVQSEQSGSAFFQERTCITFTVAKYTAHASGGRHVVVLLCDQSPKGEVQLARMQRGARQQIGRPQLQAVGHKTAGGTQSQAPLAKL